MNKEKLIYNAIKTKAYGVNRTTRPAYGQGQYDMAYEILNMVEEIINTEHKNNGWIPCSERLPTKEEYVKNDGRFIVTDGMRVYQSLYDVYEKNCFVDITYKGNCNFEEHIDNRVIAWQPLPQPYKED